MNFSPWKRAALCGVFALIAIYPIGRAASTQASDASDEETKAVMVEAGREWAFAIAQGKQSTPAAQRARARYETAARKLGYDPDDALQPRLAFLLQPQRISAAKQLAHEVGLGRSHGREAQRLRRRITALSRLMGSPDATGDVRAGFADEMSDLARRWAEAKSKARPNAAALRALENQMQRIAPVARQDPAQARVFAANTLLQPRLSTLAAQLTQAVAIGQGQSTRAQEWRMQFIAAANHMGLNGDKLLSDYMLGALRGRSEEIARALATLRNSYRPDAAKLQTLQEQLNRVCAALKISAQTVLWTAEQSWFVSAIYYLPNEIVVEQLKDHPDSSHLTFLHRKLDEAVQRRRQSKNLSDSDKAQTAQDVIAQAEASYVGRTTARLYSLVGAEKSLPHPDAENIARLQADIEKYSAKISPAGRELLAKRPQHYGYYGSMLDSIRDLLVQEHRKDAPDEARLKEIEARLIELEKKDWYVEARKSGSYTNLPPITDVEEYGRERAERIRVRVQGEKLDAQLKSTPPPSDAAVLKAQRMALAMREKELTVRMGDPLIRVLAPRDALQVVAIFADGQIKNLRFDAESQEWQARFDVPSYSAEAEHSIRLIAVLKNGVRQYRNFSYRVDLTPPRAGVLNAATSAAQLNLEVGVDDDVARVEAILPWGERVALKTAPEGNRFSATIAIPDNGNAAKPVVSFVLTDRAHNRTVVTTEIDSGQNPIASSTAPLSAGTTIGSPPI
jgi:hypothetical protein